MRIGVVGSRGFSDKDKLVAVLSEYADSIQEVVTGGARGADQLAEEWANERNIPCKVFLPDPKHGRGSFRERNKLIVANSDLIIAFWDGKSTGTKMTIEICKSQKVPYIIHDK